MRHLLRSHLVLTALLAGALMLAAVGVLAENIVVTNQYAYAEREGWINFKPGTGPGITVTSTDIIGYAWGERIGWVSLSCQNDEPAIACASRGNWEVTNDGVGNLAGYAWSEREGWISFSCRNTNPTCTGPDGNWGVNINPTSGVFTGQAWGENMGWITFSCPGSPGCGSVAYSVQTTWVPAAGATFVVNTNNDTDDGLCSFGHCSLREAINASNAVAGSQNISFNIPGGGIQTIAPLSALPAVTSPAIIDGTTQPGYTGTPLIEIAGLSAGAGVDGLRLNAGSSTVRGFVIDRFAGHGVSISGGSGNTIAANYIGTNQTASGSNANTSAGVRINSSSSNTIGGGSAADRNIISGNGTWGIDIRGTSLTNTVLRNYIGTNATGTGAVPNGIAGVSIDPGGDNNAVGNSTGGGNVISGNTTDGVQITGGSGNLVAGNMIGTNATGGAAIANSGNGVSITSATDNSIGGGTPAFANVISGNLQYGVLISGAGSTQNNVRNNYVGTNAGSAVLANASDGLRIAGGASNNSSFQNTIANNGGNGISVVGGGSGNTSVINSVYNNAGLGIDLEADGVTANDVGDADTGSNNKQNFPVLTSAILAAGQQITLSGTLNSTPSTAFDLEFFVSPACDGSGQGEGRTVIYGSGVTTDASGNVSFTMGPFGAGAGPAVGQKVTATATRKFPPYDASEFSACRTVTGPATTLVVAGYPSPAVAGVTQIVTVTAKDAGGNVVPGYTGTVNFTSSDGAATLPGNHTFTAGEAGIAIVNVTLKTAGTQSITATDIATPSISGTQSGIVVNPAAASTLVVAAYPSPTVAGVSHPFTVTAKDPFNNTATGYLGTVTFASSDGAAVLPANYTFVAGDAGVQTFNATFNTVGTQSVTATDVGTPSITGTQSGIVVNPAGPVDTDGDGCIDSKEMGPNHTLGGQRDPNNHWDFFDVPVPALLPTNTTGTRNKAISINDVISIVAYIGTSSASPNTPNANGAKYGTDLNNNGYPDGQEYDRTPGTPAWAPGAPSGAVAIADALIALSSIGDNCN